MMSAIPAPHILVPPRPVEMMVAFAHSSPVYAISSAAGWSGSVTRYPRRVADSVATTGRSGTDAVLRRSSGSLARLDAVVFTGEIGWDQPEIRSVVRAGLGLPGVPLAT